MQCVEDAELEVAAKFALAELQFNALPAILALIGNEAYDPEIDPADFKPNVTNPYFPLVPGRTLIHEKVAPKGTEHVEVTTTHQTIDIDGVTCRVVCDIVHQDGLLVEDTLDWFAEDDDGEVWYFGELVQNFEDGMLDNPDGSWRHGKDSTKAGLVMQEDPEVGDA